MRIRAKSVAAAVAVLLSPDCVTSSSAVADVIPLDQPTLALSVEAHHSSPWEWGPSARVTVPVGLSSAKVAIQPMGSYTRLGYDGGHEDRFEVGAQARYSLAQKPSDPQMWIGAEASYGFMKDKYTYGSDNYNGPAASLLFGVPITRSSLNPTIVGGAGVSHYSSTGYNLRLGVSVTPFSR